MGSEMCIRDRLEVDKYNFESVGVDIDKIFVLFNTSYDIMDQYEEQ